MVVSNVENSFSRLSLVFLFFLPCTVHAMLQNIKDTHAIVNEEYRDKFSLVNGAVAWETGVIRRLYDFGQITISYKQETGRITISHYDNYNPLVRLIHAFFYRVPGSVGVTDFGETKQLNQHLKDNPLEIAKTIAEIILKIENINILDRKLRETLFLKTLTEETNLTNEKIPKAEKNFMIFVNTPSDKNAYNALTTSGIYKNNMKPEIKKNITNLYDHLIGLNELYKNLFAQAVLALVPKITSLAQITLDALRECDQNNLESVYPEHTLHAVLLAFLYKCCSHDRNAIKAFYKELSSQIQILSIQALDDDWVNDHFEHVTQQQALEKLKAIFNNPQSITLHNDEILYLTDQIHGLPPLIGYDDAIYFYDQGHATPSFPDCMCNTIRNIILTLSYNQEINLYDPEILEQRLGHAIDEQLKDYIHKFSDPNIASSPVAHNKWINIIASIPYVAYKKIAGYLDEDGKAIDARLNGFILIPNLNLNEGLKKFLEAQNYQLIGQDPIPMGNGYEIRPSVRNLIVVLNHLLELKLFDNNGGLIKEFSRSDFVKQYFPLLCKSLGTSKHYLATNEATKQQEDKINFDVLDYTSNEIYSTLKFTLNDIKTYIKIKTQNRFHGELSLHGGKSKEEKKLIKLIKKNINVTYNPTIRLLYTNIICRQKINFDHLVAYPSQEIFINFFTTPLENTDMLNSLIEQTLQLNNLTLPIISCVKRLLFRLSEQQPDENQRKICKLKTLTNLIPKFSENELQPSPILNESIELATLAILSNDSSLQTPGIDVFCALLEKNQGVTQAIKIIEQLTLAINPSSSILQISLFIKLSMALLKKNQGIAYVIQAAQKLITLPNDTALSGALDLFMELINQGQGIKETIAAAHQAVLSPHQSTQKIGLNLFNNLFKKNQGFKEALDVAQQAILLTNSYIQNSGMKLISELVKNEQNFEEAFKIAQETMQPTNLPLFLGSLIIFSDLVSKGKYIDQAEEAGKQAMLLDNKRLQERGQFLLNLIEQKRKEIK